MRRPPNTVRIYVLSRPVFSELGTGLKSCSSGLTPAEEGTFGPHLSLFDAIGRVHPQVLGKTLPLNGAGVRGSALADLDLSLELLRGFALLARTAGLIGQLAEELRNPVANEISYPWTTTGHLPLETGRSAGPGKPARTGQRHAWLPGFRADDGSARILNCASRWLSSMSTLSGSVTSPCPIRTSAGDREGRTTQQKTLHIGLDASRGSRGTRTLPRRAPATDKPALPCFFSNPINRANFPFTPAGSETRITAT
jgi:hypothetical protein